MQPRKLPIGATIDGAYRDALVALRKMPGLFLATSILLLPLILAIDAFVQLPQTAEMGVAWKRLLQVTGLMLAITLVGVPLQISVYRLLLLDEPPAGVLAILAGSRFADYFAISALTAMLPLASGFLQGIVLATGALPQLALSFVRIALTGFILWFIVRVSMIFPSIAVDGPVRTIRTAIRATKGNFWRIVCVGFFVLFPTGAISAASSHLFSAWLPDLWPVSSLIEAPCSVASWLLGSAGCVHAYRALVEPAEKPTGVTVDATA